MLRLSLPLAATSFAVADDEAERTLEALMLFHSFIKARIARIEHASTKTPDVEDDVLRLKPKLGMVAALALLLQSIISSAHFIKMHSGLPYHT